MNTEQNQTDWSFVARWVIITTITFIAATALAYTSMWTIGGRLLQPLAPALASLISGAWVGGLMGLGLGVGQAAALRSKGINAGRWVLNSVLGGVFGFALYSVLTAMTGQGGTPRVQLALLAGVLLGLSIGAAQWLLLRNRWARATTWIAVTLVAFLPVTQLAFSGIEGREWLALLTMGLVAAGVTGLGAVWLMGGARPAVAAQVGVLLAVGLLLSGCGGATDPVVRFAEPRDGASVSAPVRVVMAAENFTVEPAGDGAVRDGAGHLHIMVDTPCIEPGNTIPKDDTHLHFGDGRIETELALAPGEHTLCLQAADGAHTALPGKGMTHTISVTVP